jgi:hypothetical protein
MVPFVDGNWEGIDTDSLVERDVTFIDGSEYGVYHVGQMFRGVARSVDKTVAPGWVEIYIKGHGTLVVPAGALRPIKTAPATETAAELGDVSHIIKAAADSGTVGVTLAWAADHVGERVIYNTNALQTICHIDGVTDTAVIVEFGPGQTLHVHPSTITPEPAPFTSTPPAPFQPGAVLVAGPDPVDHWQAAWENARDRLKEYALQHAVAASEGRKPAETANETPAPAEGSEFDQWLWQSDPTEERVTAARQWLAGLDGVPAYSDTGLTWDMVKTMGKGAKVVYQGTPWYGEPVPAPVPGFIVQVPDDIMSGVFVVLQGDNEQAPDNYWHLLHPSNLRAVVTPKPADLDINFTVDTSDIEKSLLTLRRTLAKARYSQARQLQAKAMADLDHADDELIASMLDMMGTGMDQGTIMDFINSDK